MDAKLPFDDRFAKVQRSLLEYLSDHDLYSHVMVGAKWKPWAGRVVVRAMLAGLWPREYQQGLEALVEIRGIVDNPAEVLQAIESEGICQKIVEKRRRQNAAAGRKEARNEKNKARRESTVWWTTVIAWQWT